MRVCRLGKKSRYRAPRLWRPRIWSAIKTRVSPRSRRISFQETWWRITPSDVSPVSRRSSTSTISINDDSPVLYAPRDNAQAAVVQTGALTIGRYTTISKGAPASNRPKSANAALTGWLPGWRHGKTHSASQSNGCADNRFERRTDWNGGVALSCLTRLTVWERLFRDFSKSADHRLAMEAAAR
ncbi:hypothetical protein IQ26_06561 [Mesorhizobium tianshanense]|uniref:Uncharacterized protein n=1 Tax=Mesorhizobium tianshanense TaxID=39844 RepID=A0A562MSN7_9HYPH|nr:hypothetical protein IQ26_06561 [Mesorhizobium tianshanense]